MEREIVKLEIHKGISDGELSKEAKIFISDLVETVIVKKFDKACKMIAQLNHDDNNQLDLMTVNLHKLLDLIGGY